MMKEKVIPRSAAPAKRVLSVSRRTDVPAFYMEWFMEQLDQGFFSVENPYSRNVSLVSVSPENTDTLVFWSKNFNVFLEKGYGEMLRGMGYHLFFNFTVNSKDRLLEPNVPELSERLSQLEDLAGRFGSRSVTWRFDPICHYVGPDGLMQDNLGDVVRIAERAAKARIERCVTSFADLYGKVLKRAKTIPGFSFVDPPLDAKRDIIVNLEKTLTPMGISLYLCCEKELAQTLPLGSTVRESACIPNPLISELSGSRLSAARDGGQRKNKGCGCYVSKDIGSYSSQPCFHNCLFCYANPKKPGCCSP